MKFLFTSEPPKVETGTDDILYNNYCLAVKLSKIDTSKAVVKNPETKSQRTVNKGRFCRSNEGSCHNHSDNGDVNDNVQSETVQIINCKNCDEELGVIVEKERMNVESILLSYYWSFLPLCHCSDIIMIVMR